MKALSNVNLSKLSTMRVGGKANRLFEITSPKDIVEYTEMYADGEEILVLGEGSNTIFTGDFDGTILLNKIKGIEVVHENDDTGNTHLKVGGGVNWHSFIEYTVDNELVGLENLAYIPGTVGAAPVQNVAAYGQTQEDAFIELEAIHLQTGERRIFSKNECKFSYRSSIFKNEEKGNYFITSVTYKLTKIDEYSPDFTYHSRYESLQSVLSEIAVEPYGLRDIFNAVIEIRKRKLPDWNKVGTIGSTFVNPIITREALIKLQEKFPNIQYYPVDKMKYPKLQDASLKNAEFVKVPAGWILEELGWKGKRINNVGTSPKHALCVTVDGPATGKEVEEFIEKMKSSVYETTGIKLESEANIID